MIPLRDANPSRSRAWVTPAIVLTCLVVFGWELVIVAVRGDAALEDFFRTFGVVPDELVGALQPDGAGPTEVLTLISYVFLHAGWLHAAGNLLYLWIFGNNVEDRLGPALFTAFFFAGGAAAALTQVALDPTSDLPLVGASGAISAILGAYLVLWPRARVLSLVFLGFFYQLLEVPALLLLGFWFVLQLLDSVLALGAESSADGVAIYAHIGGFLVGLLMGAGLRLIRDRAARPAPVEGGG